MWLDAHIIIHGSTGVVELYGLFLVHLQVHGLAEKPASDLCCDERSVHIELYRYTTGRENPLAS